MISASNVLGTKDDATGWNAVAAILAQSQTFDLDRDVSFEQRQRLSWQLNHAN
jgi:hypothetical protein